MPDERGVVRNKEQALQIRDFSNMRYGSITPTDIDALIEYRNKGFVIIETKYADAILPFGQRLALERLVDALHESKPSMLIVSSHTEELGADIDMGNSTVTEYRTNHKWKTPAVLTSTYSLVKRFIDWLDRGEYDITN